MRKRAPAHHDCETVGRRPEAGLVPPYNRRIDTMKVAIIGGGGLVGSCAGFALQAGRVVREIALVDVNRELAEGQALDLMHGSSLVADQTITGGGMEQIAGG